MGSSRIIWLEDDEHVFLPVARKLEHRGIKVEFAGNVSQAKALAKEADVDLAICDLIVPLGTHDAQHGGQRWTPFFGQVGGRAKVDSGLIDHAARR